MARAPRKQADAAGVVSGGVAAAKVPAATPTPASPTPAPTSTPTPAPPPVADNVAMPPVTSPAQVLNAEDAADLAEALEGIDLTGVTLSVRSASPQGRRRAGHAFGPVPVELAADDFTPEQIGALLADDQLLVGIVGRKPDED